MTYADMQVRSVRWSGRVICGSDELRGVPTRAEIMHQS